MDVKEILKHVDHTLLTQTATWAEIRQICDDAVKYGTASVCIPPAYVKQVKEYVQDQMAVCTVIGFPNGYMTTATKEFETKDCLLYTSPSTGHPCHCMSGGSSPGRRDLVPDRRCFES